MARRTGGVVRDPAVHARVLREVAEAAVAVGLEPLGAIASPMLGPEGNREFLLHLRVPPPPEALRAVTGAPGPLGAASPIAWPKSARPEAA